MAQVLRKIPATTDALARAVGLFQRGDAAAAARLAEGVLAGDRGCGPAWVLLACARLAMRDWRGALAAAEAAPEVAPALFVRGTALHALGRPGEAVGALRAAVVLAPDDAGAWLNLGNALATLDRFAEAEAALRRACALNPQAGAFASLGAALVQQARPAEAAAAYRQALRPDPAFAAARWDLGFSLLLAGEFAEGWEALRARKPEEAAALRGVRGEEWDGGAPAGRTVLAVSTQGLGDAIQFARYLPLLAERGARVLLACDARLAPLLRGMADVADALPNHDAWVALSSLPRLFGTDEQNIPAAGGYLTADPDRVAAWRARLPAGRTVGLVWAGNPAHANDARRSMPAEVLDPLLVLSAPSPNPLSQGEGAFVRAPSPCGRGLGEGGARPVSFVSLQTGPAAGALDIPAFGPELSDLADTAALLAALDAVVTVDTATAHLAGALGVPAFVALPFAPDWRWQLGRDDSPWYASLRLVRQPHPGDWASVVAAIAAVLAR